MNMVFLGCPHATLQEIKEICEYLEGNSVAEGTKFWIMTSYSIKASAERLGYDKLIKASGGELFSDGCLNMYYSYDTYQGQMPKLDRVATNSVKQAVNVKRAFGSKVVFNNTMCCIEIAVDGECYHESC